MRILLIPAFAYAMYAPAGPNRLAAAALYGAAALTDLFDGMVARRTGTITRLGRVIDPLADRALVIVVLVVLVGFGDLPLWVAALVIARDLAMILGYRVLQVRGLSPEVSMIGKVATAVLMIGLAVVILDVVGGIGVLYAGVALSVVSGLLYAKDGWAKFAGAQRSRATPSGNGGRSA